jgi:hypothetical protein
MNQETMATYTKPSPMLCSATSAQYKPPALPLISLLRLLLLLLLLPRRQGLVGDQILWSICTKYAKATSRNCGFQITQLCFVSLLDFCGTLHKEL